MHLCSSADTLATWEDDLFDSSNTNEEKFTIEENTGCIFNLTNNDTEKIATKKDNSGRIFFQFMIGWVLNC